MIRRLRASRFRSLGKDVTLDLGALTVLVGRNGAGKSNTVDALVFLADCLQLGLDGAVTKRGGIDAVRHAGAHGRLFDVDLHVEVDHEGLRGEYDLTFTGDRDKELRVKRERAIVLHPQGVEELRVEAGVWQVGPHDLRPRVDPASLALPLVAGDERFAPLADAVRSVASYSIVPDALRHPQKYDPRRPMDRSGSNWVSILEDQPDEVWKPELVRVLRTLTGDIDDVKLEHVAGFVVMQLKHEHDPKAKQKQWFDAAHESDGTLRVAGILAALLQRPRPQLVAIEEPELTVYPGAIRLLYDCIKEATRSGQVLLTTHSPDVLSLMDADAVRVVDRVTTETRVAALDPSQRDRVVQGLFSLGDVMRAEGLRPTQLDLPLPSPGSE